MEVDSAFNAIDPLVPGLFTGFPGTRLAISAHNVKFCCFTFPQNEGHCLHQRVNSFSPLQPSYEKYLLGVTAAGRPTGVIKVHPQRHQCTLMFDLKPAAYGL